MTTDKEDKEEEDTRTKNMVIKITEEKIIEITDMRIRTDNIRTER